MKWRAARHSMLPWPLRWLLRRAELPEPDTGGRAAAEDASRRQREVIERWPQVARLGDRLDEVASRNHLAEAVARALRGRA